MENGSPVLTAIAPSNEARAPNRYQVQSRIQGSRIPGLKEMNPAGTNSRSRLLQPGAIANKATAVPQPARTKSTTENARAGAGPPSASRSVNGATKSHARANSYASSTLTRSASAASRTRGPHSSSTMGRPNSSLSNPRRPNGYSIPRPATSLDTHHEETGHKVLGKRKGMHTPRLLISPPTSRAPVSSTWETRFGPRSERHAVQLALSPLMEPFLESSHSQDSLCASMNNLTLGPFSGEIMSPNVSLDDRNPTFTPSKIPLPRPAIVPLPSPQMKYHQPSKKNRPPSPAFLTKESTINPFNSSTGGDWDQDAREQRVEEMMATFFSRINQQGQERTGLHEAIEVYKIRVSELEESKKEQTERILSLRVENESVKSQKEALEDALKHAQREQEIAMDELISRQRMEIETVRFDGQKQLESLRTQHDSEIRELKRRFEHELEDEKSARLRELNQLQSQTAVDAQLSQIELDKKVKELAGVENDLQALRTELERERKNTNNLRQNLDTVSSNSVTLESTISALKARIEFLESGSQEQSQAFERLNQQMMDAAAETNAAKEKLRREETLRRKLHNQVQELKGNIRVFCRVRPTLGTEGVSDAAQFTYPDEADDCKEINIVGPEEKSTLGTVTRKNHNFSYDHVFGPSAQNSDVFDEISQLVQSALDGYNVCIFCYGQTGSGKTHTMSSLDGMIPRAVHQIWDTATSLEEKGWRYTMEGNFVEVYNENLNDLLGKAEELDKKKLEIRHDMQRGKTIITDATTVQLESPEMVETILKRAAANRSVAATKANERSSRSHSVFILKLIGENYITGERSEGTLNLVDLAGSERLSHSGATGDRLRETQNINRSLSCLGDVIAALGQGKEGGHIPYRNSKLTYLLQFSLGGNSKTLMFVMVSPLAAHLSETLTSLKFATKVHNTHIGTAKRQTRVRDV
ncbi:putative kinesin family protein (KlpA) [Aspergillus undulatus]|uniref:putative kinesin family protein (KlpA) n=1 Tax=Aspergillus undulatus TaxID=1810928 RepID=UPI003CCD3AB2